MEQTHALRTIVIADSIGMHPVTTTTARVRELGCRSLVLRIPRVVLGHPQRGSGATFRCEEDQSDTVDVVRCIDRRDKPGEG